MPIEDLMNLVEDYDKQEGDENKQIKDSRILFLIGARFSQRDEGIIGKLYIDFTYKREVVKVDSNRPPGISVSNDLYLQKEVYINRKIPLKGYLNVNIGSLSDLKDSLQNIEYLMSLYNHPDSRESMCDRTVISAQHVDTNKRVENIDRKRALLRMYKEGLNLGIVESLFEETPELRDRFGTSETRIIFQTLHPNFEYQNEHRIRMDTTIFEHLKYRFAVFEVRHYFITEDSDLLDLGRRAIPSNDPNAEFRTDERDYITLGWAKVPLVDLIRKSNGVDQDVAVLDQFNQKLGYLKIKMSLNYQSKKNMQMMKEPSEALHKGKYFLGFSFVELISQNNRYLRPEYLNKEIKNLIFKFKWKGDHHQVRYIPDDKIEELPLDITVYFINKLYLLEIEINEETFEESATPVEIQIWTKVENKTMCFKDKEELVGSIFVDIQTLLKGAHNFRLRNESKQIVNTHDGYYTVLDTQSNKIMLDRVGLSTMLIKKEEESQKERIEKMFYVLHNQARRSILDQYDLNLKGIIEIKDMKKIVDAFFEDLNDRDFTYKYLEFCELEINPTTLQSPD